MLVSRVSLVHLLILGPTQSEWRIHHFHRTGKDLEHSRIPQSDKDK